MRKKRRTRIITWITKEEATKTLKNQWGKEEDFEVTLPYCLESLSDKDCCNCDSCGYCDACLKYVICDYDEDDEHIYETRMDF